MLNAAKDFTFAVKTLEETATQEQCDAVLSEALSGASDTGAMLDFSTFVACVSGFNAAAAVASFNESDSGGKGYLDLEDLKHLCRGKDMSDAEISATMETAGSDDKMTFAQYREMFSS